MNTKLPANKDKDKLAKNKWNSIAVENIIESRTKNKLREYPVEKTRYNANDHNRLLSFIDHFFLAYMSCCVCGRTKKIKEYYEQISEIIDPYVDILSISNNVFEMEKLKYMLMDEDQVALFNLRNSKIYVEPKAIDQSRFSHYYYYTKDLDNEIDIDSIKKKISSEYKNDDFNRKLLAINEEVKLNKI